LSRKHPTTETTTSTIKTESPATTRTCLAITAVLF
jgi:hypothetical protein